VLLACQGAPEPLYELLLNLDGELPEAAPASVRVIEIIDAQPQRRAAARERFRRHRERGANLQTHHIAADAMP
jgi:DNA polymerase IIIc chi subunit